MKELLTIHSPVALPYIKPSHCIRRYHHRFGIPRGQQSSSDRIPSHAGSNTERENNAEKYSPKYAHQPTIRRTCVRRTRERAVRKMIQVETLSLVRVGWSVAIAADRVGFEMFVQNLMQNGDILK